MNVLQLEVFNGVWAILALFCIPFMIDHLRSTGVHRKLSWRGWLLHTPVGMQLAIATLGLCVGTTLSQGGKWFWRWALEGMLGGSIIINLPTGLGAFIGAWSFLCILRVVSRPHGQWPVLAALATVAAYLISVYLFG